MLLLDIAGNTQDRFWTRTSLIQLIFTWKWLLTCTSKVIKRITE
jgi:hypothetical protein